MSKYLTLFRVTSLFCLVFGLAWSGVVRADQVQARAAALGCAPLLSQSSVLQGIAITSSEGEGGNFTTAYLNLLDLVLEGIDEITVDAFGHQDRSQVKVELLNKLALGSKPINPLDDLKTQFSPTLSTLADSGQVEAVTEHLTTNDWASIRLRIQDKISELQNLQALQKTTKVVTKFDFEDEPDLQGNTQLHRALINSQYDQARLILENPDISTRYINHRNQKGQTALDLIKWTSPQEVELGQILRGRNALYGISFRDIDQKLDQAAQTNNVEEIQRLYDLGANVNTVSAGEPALFSAVKNNHVAAIRLLLKLGANIDYQKPLRYGSNSDTILIKTIFKLLNVELATINALLEGKPNFELVGPSGKTAFTYALELGRTDLMELLVSKGALPVLQNQALIFVWNVDFGATIKAAVELGVDLNAKDSNGDTQLHYISQFIRPELIKALLNNGANPNIANNYGLTPLQKYKSALQSERPRIEKDFIKRNIEIQRLLRKHMKDSQ